MTPQRIQKILARAGFASRRASERLIADGRVRVNGKIAQLGERADPDIDHITLDGEPVHADAPIYVILNKPRGVISSLKPQGDRRTVRDLVNIAGRIYPVGRLDLDSEGLILMTNDGDAAQQLTHPRHGHEREYEVLIGGHPNAEALEIWRKGVVLDDGQRTAPAGVTVTGKGAAGTHLRFVLREGRKRQIRRMAEALGFRVKRLKRVRFGPLRLGQLAPGEWRPLTPDEVRRLKQPRAVALRRRSSRRRRPRS
ncbi:MAG: pseudouridine synthase [Anaerolineales bacterium]